MPVISRSRLALPLMAAAALAACTGGDVAADETTCETVVVLNGRELPGTVDTVSGNVCYAKVYMSTSSTSEETAESTSLDSVVHDPTPTR
jgi:hypothetical protein